MVIKDLQMAALSGVSFEAARLAGYDVAVVVAVRHPHEIIVSWSAANRASRNSRVPCG